MSLLVLSDLTLRIAGRVLLEHAELTVAPGQRIGLIGRNGAGKSTLLAAIAGDIAPDGGEIRLSSRARLARIRQEAPSGRRSLLETVLDADLERARLLAESAQAADPSRIADIHERLAAIGADSAPARAGSILAGLGFDTTAQGRAVDEFSGGWRMRVALAAALFLEPDLLLLDEPTNHLDLEATFWLESWLARFSGAALIVSHDRTLLDRSVHAIAHLDRTRIALTPGGLAEFVRIRAEQSLQQNREAARVGRQRAHMQSFVDRFRASATKARQAQARLKALEKLPDLETVIETTPIRFAFPEPSPLPPPMLTLERVAVGYDGHAVLSNLSLRLDQDDRIALLGPNGRGKSTFARLLAGRLAPIAGTLTAARALKVGYFAQHQTDELREHESPVDHMAVALPQATPVMVRAQLARFGLDAQRATTAVRDLSGGEKARLLLALATREAPQLLILDEPTNHLDLDAREALVRALAEFTGAVLLISHDPHLVELVADRLWLVGDGTVRAYDGDMADYRDRLVQQARSPSREPQASRAGGDVAEARRERAEQRRALAPLRKRARDAETLLARLAEERAGLEARFADPAFYARAHADEVGRLNSRLAAIARECEQAEEVWLLAEQALEEALTEDADAAAG